MTGAVNTVLIIALFLVMALRPPIPRRSSPFNLQFALGWWINEAPQIGLYWLISGTIGTLVNPQWGVWWWLVAALAVVDLGLLMRVAGRARLARPALSGAMQTVYGAAGRPRYTRPAWWRLVVPVISWRPDVRRIRNVRYSSASRRNKLDIYLSRKASAPAEGAPVLVYFHSLLANKMLGSRALIYRLASQGWVCISADRRQFGKDSDLADTRAALTWIRSKVRDYGGDPERVVAAGGSAGANLAATAAMTGSKVAAVICLYGFYGTLSTVSPQQVIGPDAPPFLLVHGRRDTLVPHHQARIFADRLQEVSNQPVVYAELPGTQHSFDVFNSFRFHAVVDAIVHFAKLTVGPKAERA